MVHFGTESFFVAVDFDWNCSDPQPGHTVPNVCELSSIHMSSFTTCFGVKTCWHFVIRLWNIWVFFSHNWFSFANNFKHWFRTINKCHIKGWETMQQSWKKTWKSFIEKLTSFKLEQIFCIFCRWSRIFRPCCADIPNSRCNIPAIGFLLPLLPRFVPLLLPLGPSFTLSDDDVDDDWTPSPPSVHNPIFVKLVGLANLKNIHIVNIVRFRKEVSEVCNRSKILHVPL